MISTSRRVKRSAKQADTMYSVRLSVGLLYSMRSRIFALSVLAIFMAITPVHIVPALAEARFVFCDLKRSLAGRENPVTASNFRPVIDALKSKIGCNGIRVHIDPLTSASDIADIAAPESEGYHSIYRDVFRYARSKGMKIYANLLPLPDVLEFNGDTEDWSATIIAYGNYFCPDYIGPFNENGKFRSHTKVVMALRNNLKRSCVDPYGTEISSVQIVGPDSSSIRSFFQTIKREPQLVELLDVIGVHNNKGGKNVANASGSVDRSADAEDWKQIRKRYKKPVWASEVAAEWTNIPVAGRNRGQEVGLQAAVVSGAVGGIVIYMAANLLEMNSLELNAKGQAIADGLRGA